MQTISSLHLSSLGFLGYQKVGVSGCGEECEQSAVTSVGGNDSALPHISETR